MTPIRGPGGPHGPHKPAISVHLDQHYNSKVYTSGSKVSGHVEVQTHQDVDFDTFEIIFAGVAITRLDFVQQFTTHSWRPFLKLPMPIEDSQLPSPRVFRAGQLYTIPFNFVIPHQLTIGACSHKVESPAVQQEHLRIPPSVGCWEAGDMAPEMATIQYSVKATVIRNVPGNDKPVHVGSGEHTVKVLPSSPEDAPLDITLSDDRYKLSKSKTIRKALFSAKTGKLTANAAQPRAVMLSADGRDASTSAARINLQFVPDSPETAPPKINSVSAKVQAVTYFSGGPVDHLPNFGSCSEYHATPALNYTSTTPLVNGPIDSVPWRQESVSTTRRDSGYSSFGDEEAIESDASGGLPGVRRSSRSKSKSGKKSSPIRHTAAVDVPFALPLSNKKFFLPSFHNCLISRIYILHVSLSIGPTNTAVSLMLPLQIGVETLHHSLGGAQPPSFETAMAQVEDEEAEAYFVPRVMHIPPEPTHRSNLPGYEQLTQRTVYVA